MKFKGEHAFHGAEVSPFCVLLVMLSAFIKGWCCPFRLEVAVLSLD